MSQYQREKRLTDGRINLRGWRREQGRKVNLRRPRWLSAFAGKVEAGVVSLYSHNEKGGGRGGRPRPHNSGFGRSLLHVH